MTPRETTARWRDPGTTTRSEWCTGGLVCTLLDSPLGCATHTTLPAGIGYTSIEIRVNYLRPVTADSGPLTCTGRVTKPGRRVTFAEGEVLDNQGKIVATASSSLLIFPLQKS